MTRPRIVSLLPSATEIVCALGFIDALVGVSHECDFPGRVVGKRVLTRPKFGPQATSRAIDAAVRDVVRDALGVYDILLDELRAANPDVIVTQDLCDVCAVSLDDVKAAVARLARHDVAIVNLHPMRLGDIWDDVRRVGEGIGATDEAEGVVTALCARTDAIAARAAAASSQLSSRPRVLTIEWIEPVMIGGTWMPELVALAGADALVTHPGDHAPTLDHDALAALDPDVVLVKPCGFALDRTLEELPAVARTLPWKTWRAVRAGRVYVADGNAYFNRPGPRIVESLEILAACVHPAAFGDFTRRHAASVRRIDPQLQPQPGFA